MAGRRRSSRIGFDFIISSTRVALLWLWCFSFVAVAWYCYIGTAAPPGRSLTFFFLWLPWCTCGEISRSAARRGVIAVKKTGWTGRPTRPAARQGRKYGARIRSCPELVLRISALLFCPPASCRTRGGTKRVAIFFEPEPEVVHRHTTVLPIRACHFLYLLRFAGSGYAAATARILIR
jgi:hypothetical protein